MARSFESVPGWLVGFAVAAVLATPSAAQEAPEMNPIAEILQADERFAPFLEDPGRYRRSAR